MCSPGRGQSWLQGVWCELHQLLVGLGVIYVYMPVISVLPRGVNILTH